MPYFDITGRESLESNVMRTFEQFSADLGGYLERVERALASLGAPVAAVTMAPKAVPLAGDQFHTIVAPRDQEAEDMADQDHFQLQFPVVAGRRYAVQLWLVYGASATAGDYAARFAVSAGTMTGSGLAIHRTRTPAGTITMTPITATNAMITSITEMGVSMDDQDVPHLARLEYVFQQKDSNCRCRFQFGNATTGPGRIARTMRGTVLRWKALI